MTAGPANGCEDAKILSPQELFSISSTAGDNSSQGEMEPTIMCVNERHGPERTTGNDSNSPSCILVANRAPESQVEITGTARATGLVGTKSIQDTAAPNSSSFPIYAIISIFQMPCSSKNHAAEYVK
ncbi:hypothetical protein AJ78_07331 [Emergomyces pasteurianus Ep9510]|uniref:Uncharacterized protein n=1 Tax=Emergomyces pasteurianus Ep9510 TaxID=1447872 RepID=A0A1J9P7D1_9EURO|nr:hypothetical protein AJ78_07331 [Emergomyces pasteurianus Ep9510]